MRRRYTMPQSGTPQPAAAPGTPRRRPPAELGRSVRKKKRPERLIEQ